MKNNYHNYNLTLKQRARDLRSNMTKAEACLWKYILRARQLKGYSFRKQRPIDHYIADFVCLKLKLIIEVDGITHSYEGALEKDTQRQKRLESLGFHVVRFSDDEVLMDIITVKHKLEKLIEKLE